MPLIQTKHAVVTVWLATWLLIWPTLVVGSFVLAAMFCMDWYGDELGQFPFPMFFPAFFVPFFGLLVAATAACWIVPRSLTVRLKDAAEGGQRESGLIWLVVIAAVASAWWWIVTEM